MCGLGGSLPLEGGGLAASALNVRAVRRPECSGFAERRIEGTSGVPGRLWLCGIVREANQRKQCPARKGRLVQEPKAIAEAVYPLRSVVLGAFTKAGSTGALLYRSRVVRKSAGITGASTGTK